MSQFNKSRYKIALGLFIQASLLWGQATLPTQSIAATHESIWGITLGERGNLTPYGSPTHCPTQITKKRRRVRNSGSKISWGGIISGITGIKAKKYRTTTYEKYIRPRSGPCLALLGAAPIVEGDHTRIDRNFDAADFYSSKGATVKIMWPKDGSPRIPPGRNISYPFFNSIQELSSVSGHKVLWVDGAIEGIKVETGGYRSQNNIFSLLSEKFGKPTQLQKKTMIAGGEQVEAFDATWVTPDFHVFYNSVEEGRYREGSEFSRGHFWIDTHKGWELKAQRRNEYSQSPVKLSQPAPITQQDSN